MEFISAKTLLSGYKETKEWFGINYNMNIYKGCSHGCIYCDSRSECYRVDDFDVVRGKENALAIIDRELRSKRVKGVVGTGAMSDPYNPMESIYELTRGALKGIQRYGYGIHISTKSPLVVRDIDLLSAIAKKAPVLVMMTITSADDVLCRKVEPYVSPSSERFKAIKQLSDAGIPTGVLMMPILPYIEDSPENIKEIVIHAHSNGAKVIYPAFGVTLRDRQRQWFYDHLDNHFPGVKEKYQKQFGEAYSCQSPNAKQLRQMFEALCKELGIVYKMEEIIKSYQAPFDEVQLSFF